MEVKSPMRILHFIPGFSSGGAEAFIVGLVEKLDKNEYDSEIVCISRVPGVYDERLRDIGVGVTALVKTQVDDPVRRYIMAYRAFKRFMAENKGRYDIVHFNISQGEDLPFINMAKKAGVPVRILHSHNSSVNSRVKYAGHVLCKALFRREANIYLACSDIAAKWLLPRREYKRKNYTTVKNGIDVEKFRYSAERREEKRKELGIGDGTVFLNVGRLNRQKNQMFLIEAFRRILERIPDAVLLVAGEGSLLGELEKKTAELGLEDRIKWLGKHNDIPDLLFASDVFLLPSLYEGLPYTVIEAQASGLRSVIADTVSEECAVTDIVRRAPLDAEQYAEAAVEACRNGTVHDRSLYADRIKDAGFDAAQTAAHINEIYRKKESSHSVTVP